jgi:tetratricopeptide (TPR) repeat protein/predicted Ser/Thr protein kinase
MKCDTAFNLDAATMAVTAAAVMTPPIATEETFAKGWSLPSPPAVGITGSSLAPGSVLGTRYEIVQMLGQGGMGAVYKAKDLELDRVVALKVIRPELAIHPDILQRFKQELILARQITHRNVIRIFDLSEANGIKFITMEFIEGRDLKALINDKGRLSFEVAVRIVEQVCVALEAAHNEGVVHRDLKPQNIMLDNQGRAAVMDFGIARSVEAGGMTQTGMLVGTPEYMSPEQVMGEHVDVRSDLFTLGVILYELLTGAMPYQSETAQSAMFKRTREVPKAPIEIDSTVPRLLSDITAKCLQIDPALRYQSAREILVDLEAWRGGATRGSATAVARRFPALSSVGKKWAIIAASSLLFLLAAGWALRGRLFSPQSPQQASTTPAVSLAILPFRNASGDQTLDWLGSSVAETLSTDVGQSSHLRVVSSERVSQIFRDLRLSSDTSFDPPTIQRLAEFTNADNLVWGRYARFGDQIRIDATIQDVKHGRPMSLTESATENNILSAIDRIAGDIRSNLALSKSIVKELQGQSFKPSTNSVPALRDYNEGLQLARGGKYLDAIQRFDASTKEDSKFALAYSELGRTYALLGQDNDAEQASRKAVEISDPLPAQEKYLIQASHYQILRDYPKAIEAYENLAKVSPDNTDVLFSLGLLYENSSAYDKARDAFSKVLALDPKRVAGLLEIGRVEIESGNAQKGLEYLTRAQAMAIESGNDEERSEILQAMGGAYAALNKHEDAIRNYQDSLEIKRKLGLKKGIADSLQAIATSQAALGRPELALKNYNAALDLRREIGDKAGTGDALNDLAQFYDDRSQYDQALKLLKESLQVEIDVGNESNQGLVLNNIGNTYLFKADYQNARTYFEQALQVREKLKVSGDIADTLHNLAETLGKMAQYDQALQYYVRALDLRRKDGDKRSAAIESSGMGTLFAYQGRYGAALSSQEDAVKTMRDIQERGFWLAEVVGSYGQALAGVGKNDEAQKALDEAMTVAREQKNEAKIAELLGFEGDNAFYRGDFRSAGPLYDQAVQKASHTTDAHLILISKVNAAKVAVKQGRFPAASSALRTLSQEADNMGLKYVSVECSIYLAEALIGMKNYGPAKNELQNALSRSEKLGMQGLLAQSHFLLARALELSGKAAEAQDHYKQARQIADSIQKEAHTDTITKRSDLSQIYAHSA